MIIKITPSQYGFTAYSKERPDFRSEGTTMEKVIGLLILKHGSTLGINEETLGKMVFQSKDLLDISIES